MDKKTVLQKTKSQTAKLKTKLGRGALVIVLGSLMQIGCNKDSGGGSKSGSLADNSSELASSYSASTYQKVYVDEAVLDEIRPHRVECSNSSDAEAGKICILICHVPPGNAQAAKNKVIPLQALKAHLNHGHASLENRDFLGSCDAGSDSNPTNSDDDSSSSSNDSNTAGDDSSNSSDDSTSTGDDSSSTDDSSSSGDGSTTDGSSDSSGSGGDTSGGGDTSSGGGDIVIDDPTNSNDAIPLWCVPYHDIDNNCDGIDDVTGDPLL